MTEPVRAALPTMELGDLEVSRLIVGGNPFSGISHQTVQRDWEMRRYFTVDRIHETLFECERSGITAVVARTDNHIFRMISEYRDKGGTIRWIAQTAMEVASVELCIDQAKFFGAAACFVHGGTTDGCYDKGDVGKLKRAVGHIRKAGLPAGVASHQPEILERAAEELDVDFCLMCLHNISGRAGKIHVAEDEDALFRDEDRPPALAAIARIARPTIAYKVLSSGRKSPEAAFREVFTRVKDTDGILIGMCPDRRPDMVRRDADLVRSILAGD